MRVNRTGTMCYIDRESRKMDLNEAVKKLREKTGDSQQAFATRLKLSIRAIVNYEKGRTPSPKALAALALLAREYQEVALEGQFWSALPPELRTSPVLMGADNEDLKVMVQMFHRQVRKPVAETGTVVTSSDPREPIAECIRDLDSLIASNDPQIAGPSAEAIRKVVKRLKWINRFFGQQFRIVPVPTTVEDLRQRKTKAEDRSGNSPKQGDQAR